MRRKFYIDYGTACIKQPSKSYMGIWSGPQCDLTIEIDGKSFIAKGSYQKKETSHIGIGVPYAGHPINSEEKIVKVNVRYEGVITGHGIEFKLYIEDEGKRMRSSLLTALPFIGPSKEGLMIITDNMQQIKVYEKGTKETEKFYALRRK
ncbi:MAG: hypothetical protein HZC48_09865 [Nitrospirae bacterium]|nr:hypothetical protein [Nitrospirota bacterium]